MSTTSFKYETLIGALLTSVVAFGLVIGSPVSAAANPKVVAELFTSQGCSSCPPADRILQELSKDSSVLPLTLSVDYWDYLGWKDTLGSRTHSDRQRAYAAKRGDRSVYTPQLVVNGETHVVGSRRKDVDRALKQADRFSANVDMTYSDMALEVTVDGALPARAESATIYLLRVSDHETVSIQRGENAGREVTYHNVVKSIQPIGVWTGEKTVFKMPKSEMTKDKNNLCAILVQVDDPNGPGNIIGANIMSVSMASN